MILSSVNMVLKTFFFSRNLVKSAFIQQMQDEEKKEKS